MLPGLRYESVNRQWEMAEFEYRPHGWLEARRFVVARRFIPELESQTTLFTLGALRVSCLGDQYESDASRRLALLWRARWHQAGDLRTA